MEEYSAKFVNLIIKGDLQEAKEICIADELNSHPFSVHFSD